MGLCGTAETHCCWMQGEECAYVIPSPDPQFRWRCSLRSRYGSWFRTHISPEYLQWVKPKLVAAGIMEDCGDWPPPGQHCNDCGERG